MDNDKLTPEPTIDDLVANFNKFINDPNSAEVVEKILAGERARSNTISLTEFKRYERLFQLDGIDALGPEQYKELMTEYYRNVSIYDPVNIVDGNKVIMTLPPIFNRYSMISHGGAVGQDINQAFINACLSDDPMVKERLTKYANYYAQMINITNDSEQQSANAEQAQKQADRAMAVVNSSKQATKSNNEIEDIPSSNFKDSEIVSLSDNTTQEDDEEYEPL